MPRCAFACSAVLTFAVRFVQDLQLGGARLKEMLEAGQWSSPAFMKYLDMDDIERDLAVEAHLDESDADE